MPRQKLAYFPLLLDRWTAGTRFMTNEETGAYIRLLVYLYENRDHYIRDEAHIARILGIRKDAASRIWNGRNDKERGIKSKFTRFKLGFFHSLTKDILRNGGKISNLDAAHARVDPDPDPDPEDSPSQDSGSGGIPPPITPPKGGSRGKSAIGIKAYLEQCKEQGIKAIPENDTVFYYAQEAGIPNRYLWLCWREFVDRHLDGVKRQKDWRRTFRNCVRGNWYRLWYFEDGEACLTTAGTQAERKHRK